MPRLDLRICGARNLPNVETFGKIDPYCTVALEGKQFRTKTIENTCDPEWNEVFKFNVSDDNSARLHFVIWDNNLTSDTYLGEYYLSISGLDRGKVEDKWVLLQNCKKNAELHLRLEAIDFGNLTVEQRQEVSQPHPEVRPMPQNYQAPPPQMWGAPVQQGYPPQQGGYPPQQGGYPPQGYPPQQGGYPPQQGGYPPQQGGYPPQQGGYPPQQGGYPPQQGYPQQQQQHHHHHHHEEHSGYPAQLQRFFNRPVGLRSHHGMWMRAHPGHEALVSASPRFQDWETYHLRPIRGERGNHAVHICTHHGTFLRAFDQHGRDEGGKIDASATPKGWEEWELIPTPSGGFWLKSWHNSYVRAHPGAENAPIDQSPRMQDWETWTIVLKE